MLWGLRIALCIREVQKLWPFGMHCALHTTGLYGRISLQDMEPLNEALRRAASGGQLHDLRKFLESGADVHAHDLFGRSALHLAASYGNTEIVKALVALGVDVCTQSRDGRVALQFAAENGHTETVRVLEEAAGTPTVHSQVQVRPYKPQLEPFAVVMLLFNLVLVMG